MCTNQQSLPVKTFVTKKFIINLNAYRTADFLNLNLSGTNYDIINLTILGLKNVKLNKNGVFKTKVLSHYTQHNKGCGGAAFYPTQEQLCKTAK